MTDLQLGLLVAGAAVVLGVLLYNRRQERAARREAERNFASRHSDVLLEEHADRREPTLDPPRRSALPDGTAPDTRVDYVIELALPGGNTPELKEAWAPIEHRFSRRALLAVEGVNVHAGLQLVSRSGVVSDAELLEFRSEVETLATKLGATSSAPEMRAALEAARELDRACADADIQVALHVIGVRQSDTAGPGAQPFQITPREDGVTLTLDVARTLEPGRSYEAMARTGRQLAASGGGRLVDDNGRPVDDRALASIGAQLDAVCQALAGRGIEPGSALALRLFS